MTTPSNHCIKCHQTITLWFRDICDECDRLDRESLDHQHNELPGSVRCAYCSLQVWTYDAEEVNLDTWLCRACAQELDA